MMKNIASQNYLALAQWPKIADMYVSTYICLVQKHFLKNSFKD